MQFRDIIGQEELKRRLVASVAAGRVSHAQLFTGAAVQAMFFSALLMWLSFVLTGLIIYVFNIITGTKFIGVCVASFFIIFTAVADGKSMITRVSPMSWNSLNNIDIGGMTEYPGIVYVLTLYIVMIVVLSVIAVAAGRKISINSSDEV